MEDEMKQRVWFTPDDKSFLVQIVDRYKNVIENKKTDAVSNTQKTKAWLAITEEFNSIGSVIKKTEKQLKKAWQVMKAKRRRELVNESADVMRTGGGPPAVKKPTTSEIDAVMSLTVPITDAIDSNSLMFTASNPQSSPPPPVLITSDVTSRTLLPLSVDELQLPNSDESANPAENPHPMTPAQTPFSGGKRRRRSCVESRSANRDEESQLLVESARHLLRERKCQADLAEEELERGKIELLNSKLRLALTREELGLIAGKAEVLELKKKLLLKKLHTKDALRE